MDHRIKMLREYLKKAGMYEGKHQETRVTLEAEFPRDFLKRMVAEGFFGGIPVHCPLFRMATG